MIGKSTVEAIRGGVLFGYSAAVDGIVGRIRKELGGEVRTIATGGLAGVVVPFCDSIDEIDPDLTLRGLHLIWHKQDR